MSEHCISGSRRNFLIGLTAVATLPALQGCFPLVAGGTATAALMYSDRRTSGIYVEDEGIEWRTRSRLRERFGNAINVGVTSFNRTTLLIGQVPDEATRSEVGRIAASIDNVRAVHNEVEIAGISSLSSRSNDALITSQVKARLVDAGGVSAHHVKVVTEMGTVFLLGLVTQRESDIATDVARNTSGVQKVVRLFEYVSQDEALRLDRRPRA